MQGFENSVGFITGGASGIGLGVAAQLGQRGMHVVLADVEEQALERSAENLREAGVSVTTEVLDVRDAENYQEVARRTLHDRGGLNFLFNNAGVAPNSKTGGGALEDWRWAIDVNILGVVHGVESFLPAMRESKEPGYIINTASLAGHVGSPGMAAYCATKFAVVGYSEVLRQELSKTSIRVSVLCPGWVKTRIAQSRRNHPSASADEPWPDAEREIDQIIAEQGISVEALAQRVVAGMETETFYLFTHPEFWPQVEKRLQRIHSDYAEVMPG